MATETKISTNGVEPVVTGPVMQARRQGRGPAIWLAGDPEDLKQWMDRGAAGIVTNTVVLNDMVKKYGQIKDVVQRYLDITDKPVVVEVDGHSTDELIDVSHVFTRMSDQIIIKIPCTSYGLGAFRRLAEEGIETYCTTVFSLPQAAAVAQAGATHILPFCEPSSKWEATRPNSSASASRCSRVGKIVPTSPPPSSGASRPPTPPSATALMASSSSGPSSRK